MSDKLKNLLNVYDLLSNEEKYHFFQKLNNRINHKDVVVFLNENNVDYYECSDLEMYSKYYELIGKE